MVLPSLVSDSRLWPRLSTARRPVADEDGKKDWLVKDHERITSEGVRAGKLVKAPFKPSARVKPHINTLLGDAYNLLQKELEGLQRNQEENNGQLKNSDALRLKNHIDGLVKLARKSGNKRIVMTLPNSMTKLS